MIAEVFANRECTVRPIVDNEYNELFIKFFKPIYVGNDIVSFGTGYDNIKIDGEDALNVTVTYCVDFVSLGSIDLVDGYYMPTIETVYAPEPYTFTNNMPLTFYL